MTSLNESQVATLHEAIPRADGFLPELEWQWLSAVTGLDGQVNEMWEAFLQAEGFNTGALNTDQLAYWYSLGAPAGSTWNEAYLWFLANAGGALDFLTVEGIVVTVGGIAVTVS